MILKSKQNPPNVLFLNPKKKIQKKEEKLDGL
jgi:hypothetical protein